MIEQKIRPKPIASEAEKSIPEKFLRDSDIITPDNENIRNGAFLFI